MSDRLTAEPGTTEFLKQLLAIAEGSDHPIDVRLAVILQKQIDEITSEQPEETDEGPVL